MTDTPNIPAILKEANLPADLMDGVAQDLMGCLRVFRGAFLRLPQVKVAHGTDLFNLPDGNSVKKLEGFMVTMGAFKELYPEDDGKSSDDEIKPPDCFSINFSPGSKYGECEVCDKGKWHGKSPPECKESRRCIVFIKGHRAPYELKISTTNFQDFSKTTFEGVNTFQVPYYLLNFEMTLSVEKKGKMAWSNIQAKYTMMDEVTTNKIVARKKLYDQYKDYFEKVYVPRAGRAEAAEDAGDAVDTEPEGEAKTLKKKLKTKNPPKATNTALDEIEF